MLLEDHDTYNRTAELLRTRKGALLGEQARLQVEIDKVDTAIALVVELAGTPIVTRPAPKPAEERAEDFGNSAESGGEPTNGNYVTMRQSVVDATKEMLAVAGRPLVGSEILDMLKDRSHPVLERMEPEKAMHRLSVYLSSAKDDLTNIRGRGYWIAGQEPPAETTSQV